MSLAIDVSAIGDVLFGNEWHHVNMGSFYIDAYEFIDTDQNHRLYGEGAGFEFNCLTCNRHHAGPMSAIQAVNCDG